MIKLCYDVSDYRRQILDAVNDGDCVIELGCHTGNTSKVILEKDVDLIALDNSPEALEEMSKLDLTFINADVRLHDTLSEVFKLIQKCDILAIDLGGGYHPDTVFKVFYIWSSTFKPKHTFIRNRGLVEFYNSVTEVEGNYKSESGFLDSYKDSGIPPQIKEFDLWTPMPRK
ncbi:MAG: class I SAM-dependent methyltransferase [Methanobrevibacter sp.]|nr:class I SAM-dependent methyltransferase [Methanobrevibacter sp.]